MTSSPLITAAGRKIVQLGTQARAAWTACKPRERAALLVALAVLAGSAVDLTLLGPGQAERAALRAELIKQEATRTERQATLDQRRAVVKRLQAEEANLRKRIEEADIEVQALRSSVTPGPQMLKRLRQYSNTDARLKLVALTVEPAEPVSAGTPALYRLPVVVTLDGDYAALAGYLRKLESAGGLRWRSLELQAQSWPTLRLKLKVFTLGEQPSWPV